MSFHMQSYGHRSVFQMLLETLAAAFLYVANSHESLKPLLLCTHSYLDIGPRESCASRINDSVVALKNPVLSHYYQGGCQQFATARCS